MCDQFPCSETQVLGTLNASEYLAFPLPAESYIDLQNYRNGHSTEEKAKDQSG